jgi:hypothetical protein
MSVALVAVIGSAPDRCLSGRLTIKKAKCEEWSRKRRLLEACAQVFIKSVYVLGMLMLLAAVAVAVAYYSSR